MGWGERRLGLPGGKSRKVNLLRTKYTQLQFRLQISRGKPFNVQSRRALRINPGKMAAT